MNPRPSSERHTAIGDLIATLYELDSDRAIVTEILPLLLLRIDGVEVTQAIQYYRADSHLTDPADRGPDNSVRLVARKPALVRVYLRSLFTNTTGVTGRLKVYRRQHGFFWSQVADLGPEPPGTASAPTSAVYATERGNLGSTLNFVVPTDVVRGVLRFDVEVESPAGHRASRSLHLDATLHQTLRMRIVPVSYNGPNAAGTGTLNLAAPTLAQAQATAAFALRVFPVRSTPNISLTGAVNLTFPLTGAPASAGGCAQSWLNLNVLVAQARTADGAQANTFYYGLVPAGVPLGANSGCASSGVTSGMVNNQVTMAHEFGHALGYPHAPCGGVGASADASYPAYEPYDAAATPGGSIGEYGLDVNAATLKSPATFRDFMGYCNPDWISLYNYQRAFDNPRLAPFYCSDHPWWWDYLLIDPRWVLPFPWPEPDPPPWLDLPPWFDDVVEPIDTRRDVVSLIGVRHMPGEIEVRSLTRAFAAPDDSGAPGDMIAQLVDEDGGVIASAPVLHLKSHGEGCGCSGGEDAGPVLFQAMLPAAESYSGIRLLREGEPLWSKGRPDAPPSPPSMSARVRKDRVDLTWKLERGCGDLEVWIRARRKRSRRDSARVVHVATGPGKTSLGFEGLAPGEHVIDAVVHDGFDTVPSEPVTIEVPDRGPSVVILSPLDRQTLPAGRTLRLHGLATAADGTPVDDGRCHWTIGKETVADGLDAWVTTPPPGEHDVTLLVKGGDGEAKVTCSIRTVGHDGENNEDVVRDG